MCSEFKYYKQGAPANPSLYYKLNRKTGAAYYFANHTRTWVKSGMPPIVTKDFLEHTAQLIAPPSKPYSCSKCQNEGCEKCIHLPWSICNVFKK